METKICVNPTCKNVLRAQDIFCGQCGSEQSRQSTRMAENGPDSTTNSLDLPVSVQVTSTPLAQSSSMEDILVSEKQAPVLPPTPGITPFAPLPDLIGRSCPVCLTDLYPVDSYSRELVVECPACHSYHHQKCWEINQGCSTYGCKFTPSAEVHAALTTVHSSDETLPETPYQHAQVLPRIVRKGSGMAFLANLVLICGLVPFLAPLCLLLGVFVLAFNRQGLQSLSPSHRMRFWVGLVAGCVIMLLFLLAGMIYMIF